MIFLLDVLKIPRQGKELASRRCLLKLLSCATGEERLETLLHFLLCDQTVFKDLQQMMLPGNILLFSIRTLLFRTGEQSSLLSV